MDANRQAEVGIMIDQAGAIARLFLPQFTAYILLGQTVAKAAPEVYEAAVKLLKQKEPSMEERTELARRLEALAHPETLR